MANPTAIEEYDIDTIKNDYSHLTKEYAGKSESIYVVVLYNCTAESLLEFTLAKTQVSSKIKDTHRRARAKKAYYNLKEFGETFQPSDILNYCILMDVERNHTHLFNLPQRALKLLSAYDCENIWLRCDDRVDVEELSDYLESDHYYNLFRIRNNTIRYIRLGRTKKVEVESFESKTLNPSEFISTKLERESSKKFLAYGVSSKLASISANSNNLKAYAVLSHDISDSDAFGYIEKLKQSDILDEMEEDLEMIQNPRTMHRVLFKKDMKPSTIINLKKIYIDKDMTEKFMSNCEKNQIDVSFMVHTIDRSVKDFQDGREKKLKEVYAGVFGITYY